MSAPIETEAIRNLKISQGVISDAQSNIMRNLTKIGTIEGPASLSMDAVTSFDELVAVTDKIAKIGEAVRTIYNPAFDNKFLSLEQEIETLTEEENRRRILEEQRRIQQERIDSFRVRVDAGDLSLAQFEKAQEIARRLLEGQEIQPKPTGIGSEPGILRGGSEEGEDQEVYKVAFPNGKIVETKNDIDAKILEKFSLVIRGMVINDQRLVEFPESDIVRFVYNTFDYEHARIIEAKTVGTLINDMEGIGYKVNRIQKTTVEQPDPRLRRIYKVELTTPPKRDREDEGFSESEKVLRVLETLLDNERTEASVVINLMRERLERRFPNDGERALTSANAIAELMRVIKEDLYDKIISGSDDIFRPQIDLWNKVKEKSGQQDDFTARRFFEARIRGWYNTQARNPEDKGVGNTAALNGQVDEPTGNKRGGLRETRDFVVSGGGTFLVRGKGAIQYIEAFIGSKDVPLSYKKVAVLVGETDMSNASAQINNIKKTYASALERLGYEIHTEGSRGSMTVVLRRIESALSLHTTGEVGLALNVDQGAEGQLDKRADPDRNNEKNERAATIITEIRKAVVKYNLVSQPDIMSGPQVSRAVPVLRQSVLNNQVEKKQIRVHHFEGNNMFFTRATVARAIIVLTHSRGRGGINSMLLEELDDHVEEAVTKAVRSVRNSR